MEKIWRQESWRSTTYLFYPYTFPGSCLTDTLIALNHPWNINDHNWVRLPILFNNMIIPSDVPTEQGNLQSFSIVLLPNDPREVDT